MFETFSARPRPRRSPLAVALTLGLNGTVAALAVWLTAPSGPVAEAREVEPIERYAEIRLPPPGPAAVPSRGSASAGGGRRPPVDTPAPTPPAPALPEPGIALPPDDPGLDGSDALGTGTGDGTGDGPGDDTGTGDGTGRGPGGGGGGPRVVHWSEVVPTHRVRPHFPDAALAAGVKEGTCVVRLDVDARGVPTGVAPVTCPDAFVRSALDAAMGWRFEPLDGGVPARFDLRIEYRSR